MPVDDDLAINILPLAAALKYTSGIQKHAILGVAFGLIALEDANNSNPYCYITNGPTRGAIMYLCHDGDSEIAFETLADFLAAINNAIASRTFIDSLPRDPQLAALNRKSISQQVNEIFDAHDDDDKVAELCVLIPVIPTNDIDLIVKLAAHPDFLPREALALQIARHPHESLESVAQQLAEDTHPQVAASGKRASSAVNRVRWQRESV